MTNVQLAAYSQRLSMLAQLCHAGCISHSVWWKPLSRPTEFAKWQDTVQNLRIALKWRDMALVSVVWSFSAGSMLLCCFRMHLAGS